MAHAMACDEFPMIGKSNSSVALSGRWYVTIEYPLTVAAFRTRMEFVLS